MLRFQPPSSCSSPASPGAADTDPDATERDATKRSAGGAHRPRGPRRVVVTQVTVPLVTLAGIQDAPGSSPVTGRSPHRSRGSWRHGPGSGGGCSPTRPPGSCAHADEYRIPEAVRRFVQARDRVYSHAAVTGPPRTADLDHANATTRTGRPARATSRPAAAGTNAKTHHRWRIQARLGGRHLTTSPVASMPPLPTRRRGLSAKGDLGGGRTSSRREAGEHGIDLIDQLADPARPHATEWAHIDRQLASVS